MEEICIIVQTGFFNRDNELIAIKYMRVRKMNKKFKKILEQIINNLKDESLRSQRLDRSACIC